MQLTLTVMDRMRMSDLYPQETDMTERAVTRDIMEKVELDQAEVKKVGMKSARMPDGKMGWAWDVRKDTKLKVNFTRAEGQFLKRRVEDLHEKKKIKDEMYDVCVKIREAKLKDEKSEKKKGK